MDRFYTAPSSSLSFARQLGKVAIYLLVDSRSPSVVRYVGVAALPRVRHLQHCTELSTTSKGEWIEGLRDEGVLPQMIVVEWVAEDLGPKTERLWIERVKPDLLTNHSMVHRRSKLDRQLKQKLRNEAEDRIINQRLQSLLASPAEQPGSLTLLQTEYARILQVLRDCAGNKMEAARRLGIGRQTLYNKLRVIGLAQADVLAASPGNGSVGDGVSG